MSALTIYDESATLLHYTENPVEITELLQQAGILFTRWPAKHVVQDNMQNEEILSLYQTEIAKFVAEGGYSSVDTISLHANHPDKETIRNKFLAEHTHSEDEIRFFVRGQGLFNLHIADKIYAVFCCQNDLLSVPAGVPHWFDLGENPHLTAIRFFNNPDGWIANYTGSTIALKFPLLDPCC